MGSIIGHRVDYNPGGGGLLNRNFGGGVPLVLQRPDPVLN